jgi:hypothetical protein
MFFIPIFFSFLEIKQSLALSYTRKGETVDDMGTLAKTHGIGTPSLYLG